MYITDDMTTTRQIEAVILGKNFGAEISPEAKVVAGCLDRLLSTGCQTDGSRGLFDFLGGRIRRQKSQIIVVTSNFGTDIMRKQIETQYGSGGRSGELRNLLSVRSIYDEKDRDILKNVLRSVRARLNDQSSSRDSVPTRLVVCPGVFGALDGVFEPTASLGRDLRSLISKVVLGQQSDLVSQKIFSVHEIEDDCTKLAQITAGNFNRRCHPVVRI